MMVMSDEYNIWCDDDDDVIVVLWVLWRSAAFDYRALSRRSASNVLLPVRHLSLPTDSTSTTMDAHRSSAMHVCRSEVSPHCQYIAHENTRTSSLLFSSLLPRVHLRCLQIRSAYIVHHHTSYYYGTLASLLATTAAGSSPSRRITHTGNAHLAGHRGEFAHGEYGRLDYVE